MKHKWLFYFTGFISGLSVMAIELGASRLMAPYFSSSQIVWTIIIGTIMIAMALGNVIGGRMADKYKTPDRLFGWIFAAATWTMLIPLVGKFIIAGTALVLALFVKTGYLIAAAFVSAAFVGAERAALNGLAVNTNADRQLARRSGRKIRPCGEPEREQQHREHNERVPLRRLQLRRALHTCTRFRRSA